MLIEWVSIDTIRPYDNNPRKNDKSVDAVAESIKEFGWQQAIVVDKNGVIVCGHTRYKAAKKLGINKVPVKIADELTDEQIKAYRLADNKTAELSEWDFGKLFAEMKEIEDISMESFGFDEDFDGVEGEDYQEFVEKFELKKTTDDCYTPPTIYEVVANYVADTYGIRREDMVRPFYPGGDYEREKYKPTDVVVDNPPFSILGAICRFYNQKGVKFFLFAPGLVAMNYVRYEKTSVVCVGATVTYDNTARVATSFLTNMNGDVAVEINSGLYQAIKEENDRIEREMHAELPKYEYPNEVLSSAKANYLAKYGQNLKIPRESTHFIRKLEAQGSGGIYGSAVLLSEKAAAEKAAAEKAAAEKAAAEKAAATVWELSEKEKAIIQSLSTGESDRQESNQS